MRAMIYFFSIPWITYISGWVKMAALAHSLECQLAWNVKALLVYYFKLSSYRFWGATIKGPYSVAALAMLLPAQCCCPLTISLSIRFKCWLGICTNNFSVCVSKIRGVGTFVSIGAFSFIGAFRGKGTFWPRGTSFFIGTFPEKGTCKKEGTYVLAGACGHTFPVGFRYAKSLAPELPFCPKISTGSRNFMRPNSQSLIVRVRHIVAVATVFFSTALCRL